ncbi:hypothetical protein [Nocardia callitridis]|uniref:Uncharacterized protein n=1 Tax=Nocardia callitridis TaxID=648753 RepID=A0ABP9KEZ0_9NOCA
MSTVTAETTETRTAPLPGVPAAHPALLVASDARAAVAVAADVEVESGAHADLGFDTIPRVDRARRSVARPRAAEVVCRAAVDRRPGTARPRAAVIGYDRAPRFSPIARESVVDRVVDRRRPVEDPMRRVEQARVGFATLAVTALLTALVVVGMILLAHARAGSWDAGSSSSAPSVVQSDGAAQGVVTGSSR